LIVYTIASVDSQGVSLFRRYWTWFSRNHLFHEIN